MDINQKPLTLVRKDVEAAIKLYVANEDHIFPPLGLICPIFQALKRNGLEPVFCGRIGAVIKNRNIKLDESARSITSMHGDEWKDLLKEKFPIRFHIT